MRKMKSGGLCYIRSARSSARLAASLVALAPVFETTVKLICSAAAAAAVRASVPGESY